MASVTKEDIEKVLHDHLLELFSNLLNNLTFEEIKISFHKGDPRYGDCFARLLVFENVCYEFGLWGLFCKKNPALIERYHDKKRTLGKRRLELIVQKTDQEKGEGNYLRYIIETYKKMMSIIPPA